VTAVHAATCVAVIRDTLTRRVNPDGGWGYYEGGASRLEPTCWALLALGGTGAPLGSNLDRHRAFFAASQRRDGLLLEPMLREEDRPNLAFNALAALLLAAHPELGAAEMLEPLLAALLDHRGIKLPASPFSPQNNSLQAWAWIDSTFSWVEPTCWCMLALKKTARSRKAASARLEEAERLLRDRCCGGGGWNAGTASVLGQGLNPYVPTTALGLIALQNLPGDPVVVRSVSALQSRSLSERSAMALALTVIAFAIFGIDTSPLEQALEAQWSRTSFLGNVHLAAMALYSLTVNDHGMSAFRI
jgi:hypothetical protein